MTTIARPYPVDQSCDTELSSTTARATPDTAISRTAGRASRENRRGASGAPPRRSTIASCNSPPIQNAAAVTCTRSATVENGRSFPAGRNACPARVGARRSSAAGTSAGTTYRPSAHASDAATAPRAATTMVACVTCPNRVAASFVACSSQTPPTAAPTSAIAAVSAASRSRARVTMKTKSAAPPATRIPPISSQRAATSSEEGLLDSAFSTDCGFAPPDPTRKASTPDSGCPSSEMIRQRAL